jgi:DNA-binding winged helix-turn-helix (wHTH) protein
MATVDRLCFGEFCLDPTTGELTRNGTPISLERQPALVLARLAAAPGTLVSREELSALLWGSGTHVKYDDGLNYCMRRIRVALQDDPRSPRYIETIPRRGYRFIAVITPATSQLPRPRRSRVPIMAAALLVIGAFLESQPNRHHEIAVALARAVHDMFF